MKAEIALTPAESKKLIAKAIVQMDSVLKAMKKGILVICKGSTIAYVLEEIQGSKIDKGKYTAGYIGLKGLSVNPKVPDEKIYVNGILKKDVVLADIVKELKAGDVIIKGANAIGPDGIAAELIGKQNPNTTGGTLGLFQMTAMSRGVAVIVPVGLEKSIPISVLVGCQKLSSSQVDYSTGIPCALIPIFGTVITEVEALKSIADVEVIPIAGGGIGGAEGSVVFLVEGKETQVNKVINIIEGLKGELPILEPK